MESTVKRHEKIRDFILNEVMVAHFTAYHCVCMQMQQTQKWWEFNSCNTIFSHRLFGGEWYLPFNSELASKHVKKALFPCVFYTD